MIRQWEEAGTSLASAIKNYLRLCLSLSTGVPSSKAGTGGNEALGSLLDSVLNPGGLHAIMAQQLSQSRSVLAQTRNKILAAPIYCFPVEILSEIFSNVIYGEDYEGESSEIVYMGTSIKTIYHRLHQLLGVCSIWRNAALAQSALWSFIPVIHDCEGFSTRRATNLSLQRALGTNLYLAAILPLYPSYRMFDDLAKHSSRFRVINIITERDPPHEVRHLFGRMLESSLQSLSELSLYLTRSGDSNPSINTALNLRQRYFCQGLPQFTDLFASLSKINLRGAGVCWSRVTFSDRLVELRLEDFVIGHKSELDIFFTALASASKLRTLSLISITTFNEMLEAVENEGGNTIISLPNLETLSLKDLYFNTLQAVLRAITPGEHYLTLYLTTKVLQLAAPTEPEFEDAELDGLCRILSSVRVDTLLLCGRDRGNWLSGRGIRALLQVLPCMKTLKMRHWEFRSSECRALERPQSTEGKFPAIEIYIYVGQEYWTKTGLRL